MIYIVFDTNIWLYLANGYDSEKDNYFQSAFTEHHFEVLRILKEKVQSKEYTLLVNSLIFKEWERNKHNTEELIKFLENKKKELNQFQKQIKAFISKNDFDAHKELVRKAELKINEKIAQNKQHINEVEFFLKNGCIEIPISENVVKHVSQLAMEKQVAPFLRDKNNFPDAVILYSAVEFLKDKLILDENKGLFVSNNYKDFAEATNPNVFHKDIKNYIEKLDLTYERHLTKVLGLSEELKNEIDYFLDWKREYLEKSYFRCQSPFCYQDDENTPPYGYFQGIIRFTESSEEFEDPNQLKLFQLPEIAQLNFPKSKTGHCNNCRTFHITCPHCETLMIDPDDTGIYYCRECDDFFELRYSQRNKENVLIEKKVL